MGNLMTYISHFFSIDEKQMKGIMKKKGKTTTEEIDKQKRMHSTLLSILRL